MEEYIENMINDLFTHATNINNLETWDISPLDDIKIEQAKDVLIDVINNFIKYNK